MPTLKITQLKAQPRFNGEPQIGCSDSGGQNNDVESEDTGKGMHHVPRRDRVLYPAMPCRRNPPAERVRLAAPLRAKPKKECKMSLIPILLKFLRALLACRAPSIQVAISAINSDMPEIFCDALACLGRLCERWKTGKDMKIMIHRFIYLCSFKSIGLPIVMDEQQQYLSVFSSSKSLDRLSESSHRPRLQPEVNGVLSLQEDT